MLKLELDKKPTKPIIIEGFPGFGFVSTIVTEYLIKHLNAKPIGRITSDKISPIAAIHKSQVIYPLEIFYDPKTNILILQAVTNIDGLEWEIADTLLEMARELKAKEIIGLEGVSSNVAIENPKVFFYSNNEAKTALLKTKKMVALDEGIIIGVTGALLMKAKEMPLTSFFVEASSNLPDNLAAGKMIETLNTYLGLNIDTKPLAQKAKEFEDKIKGIFSKVAEAQIQKDQKKLSYMG